MVTMLHREGDEREGIGAVRESLSVKVTFMLRSELQDGILIRVSVGRALQAEERARAKVLRWDRVACLRSRQQGSVAAVQWARGTVRREGERKAGLESEA